MKDEKPIDKTCAQLLSLLRMMGAEVMNLSIDAKGKVLLFASAKEEAPEDEPLWMVTAQVGPSRERDWQDAPLPSEAILQSSPAISVLSRKRHALRR